MTSVKVTFQRLDRELSPPRRAHHDDAGFDLVSATDVRLEPGERDSVPTGLAVAIPQGYAGLVLPRSGHAARYGVALVNSPGLIDAGYRGEIRVLMINHGNEPVVFNRGERIAQLVIIRLPLVAFEETDELGGSIRGDGGFGSTGS